MEPFLAVEALASGALTFRELKRFHRQVFPRVWVDRCADLSSIGWSGAGWLWSRRVAVLGGLSASAALGAKWIDAGTPVEMIHTNRRPPTGIVVHTDLKVVDIEAVAGRHPRANGLVQLRETLESVDGGAESLYESPTRLLLVQAGFPRPETQIEVFDDNGYFVARVDMGWREFRVGVDFAGAHHWTEPRQFTKDVDRYARLSELGWKDVRLTSGILHNSPQVFLQRASDALIARGCPRTW